MALGALWMLIWQGRARVAGVVPVLVALALWAASPRPLLLVSGDGALVGLMGPEGRAMSSPKGAGFAAKSWLENDGDFTGQVQAAARPGFTGPPGQRRFDLAGLRGIHLKGKAALAALPQACAENDLVITSVESDGTLTGCVLFDEATLASTGALAIGVTADGKLRVTPADASGRLWSGYRQKDQGPELRLSLNERSPPVQ
jgi:competence protein ComEC